jgi:predicted polyphosphate/ATP-dependent NAD kinase
VLPVGARSAAGATRTATIYDAPAGAAGLARELAGGRRTEIVPAPDAEAAVQAARRLVDEGVELVQICGGAPIGTAVAVAAALGDRVAVTATVWPFDALAPAAAFAAEHSPHADQFRS